MNGANHLFVAGGSGSTFPKENTRSRSTSLVPRRNAQSLRPILGEERSTYRRE